jgi:hypothetical protein
MSGKKSSQFSPNDAADKRTIDLIEGAFADTYDDLLAIFSAKIELLKLDMAEALASLAAALIVFAAAFAGVVYLMTAVAIFLGELFGKASLGYLTISLTMFVAVFALTKLAPTLLRNVLWKLIQRQLDKLPPVIDDDDDDSADTKQTAAP